MNQGKVLVIAGGQWQVPLIKFLVEKGYYVIVVDPYDTSAGVKLANHHIKADVRDSKTILQFVQDIKLDFIVTDQSDISVETVAFLNEHLNLPGNSLSVVELFSNKFMSRNYAQSIHIPIPKFLTVKNVDDINSFCKENGFPVILKPVDSQSSRGIHKLTGGEFENLPSLLNDTLKAGTKEYALIEQFVDGVEVTVEGFCSNYKHKSLAYSSKKHFRTGIASSLEYPADIPDDLMEKVMQANDNYVAQSGLNFGITHAEYIINVQTGEFWLIEIACRGGGTLISSDIAKWVSGIDLYENLLKCLKGEKVDVEFFKPLNRSAILYFFEFPGGQVKAINGLEDAKSCEGVLELQLFFQPGTFLKDASDDRSRQGFVILFADSKNELIKRLERVKQSLDIVYE